MDLGGRDDGGGGGLDDDGPRLHRTTDHGGGECVAGAMEKQAVTAGGLASRDGGEDGAWEAS